MANNSRNDDEGNVHMTFPPASSLLESRFPDFFEACEPRIPPARWALYDGNF